jgi:hypothetical protein
MWEDLKTKKQSNFVKRNIRNLFGLFSISNNNIVELFDNGYNDAKLHKQYFDSILESKEVPEL